MNKKAIRYSRHACRGVFMAGTLLALAACANVTHMMLYQNNKLGISGGYNPETSNASLVVGYKSDFIAMVPKVNISESGTEYAAASVYSGSHMVIHGLGIPDISEITATGSAAILAAQKADAAKPVTQGTASKKGS